MQKILKFPDLYPLLLMLAAIALRVVLSILGWTPTNSDESIMNLMALHIAYHGEHPTFFYGQNYMGAFEAYVGAVLFRIFGPSVLVMRLEMIGFYACFLIVLYALISKLYTRRFALFMLVLLALGSRWTLLHQLEAIGGYPELPLFVALLLLIAYRLVSIRGEWRWYWLAGGYALWGCLAGLALWIDIIAAPYVLVAGSLLLLWGGRNLLKVGVWASLIGFVIGAWPLLWYNLHAMLGQDSLSVALRMTDMGQGAHYDFWAHILGSLLVSVPLATGFSSQCVVLQLSDQYPFWPTFHPHCIVEQAVWGGGYFVLLIIALVMACLALWHLCHISRGILDDRSEAIQQSARLFLLIGAVLTLVSYIRGGAPVLATVNGSRYLTCTWVSLPAILWPLWAGAYYVKQRWLANTFSVLRVISALILVIFMAYQTSSIFREIPQAQETTANIEELSTYLQKAGITRFYSEYWTCNRLIFVSQEKLICANAGVAGNKISHEPDRYKPYRAIVEAAHSPAFVYPVDDPRVQALEQELKREHLSYSHNMVAGYVVDRPSRPVTVT